VVESQQIQPRAAQYRIIGDEYVGQARWNYACQYSAGVYLQCSYLQVYFPNLDWVGHEKFFVRLDGLWNIYLHPKMGHRTLLAKFVIYLQPTLAVTLWPVPNPNRKYKFKTSKQCDVSIVWLWKCQKSILKVKVHLYTRHFWRHPATGAPYWPGIACGPHVTFFKMKASWNYWGGDRPVPPCPPPPSFRHWRYVCFYRQYSEACSTSQARRAWSPFFASEMWSSCSHEM
jgi:hypothetical protein